MTAAWPVSTVGEQFDVQLGKMLDAAKNSGVPKPYLGNRAVKWGRIDLSAVGIVPLTSSDERRYRLRRGDLLVCEGGEVGRGAIWRDELPECYYQKALHRLRPKSGYDVRLMLALLEYWSSVGAFSNYMTQTSIAHLPRDKFVQMPLPLQSAAEQNRIGDVLQDVDDQIATLERMIAKKQTIKQGMMQQLLAGKTRLPRFDGRWRQVCLRDAGCTYGGLAGKTKDDFGTGSASFVTFMEVMAGPRLHGGQLERVRVHPSERQNRVQRGDVLFNGSSETPEELALAAMVDFEPSATTFLNSFCFGYRLKQHGLIDPAYLAYFFRSGDGRGLVASLAQGATRYNIAKTKLLDLSLSLPSIDEQRGIVAALRHSEDQILTMDWRLAKARDVKQGLMQQLLTGRIRLPAKETVA